MSYSPSDLSNQEPLKNQIHEQEQQLENWQSFLQLVDAESEQAIVDKAEEDFLIHYNSSLNYSFDHDTLNSIDKVVAAKNGIIPNYTYHVKNIVLRKGKNEVIKSIKNEILSRESRIKAFKATLENSGGKSTDN